MPQAPKRALQPARPASYELTGSVLRRSVQIMTRGIAAEPRTYALAIGVSGLFGAATVAVSQVLGVITDDVIVPALAGSAAARDRLPLAGLVLAAVAVTLGVSVALRRIFAGIGYADLQAGHRSRVTRQYLRLPLSWHRQHPTGQLLSNANSDVEAATGVFNPLPYALGVAVMIAVATVALLRADGWLAVAALAVLPVAVIANLVFQRAMSPAITRAQQLRAEVSDIAHESFEAALLVKSLGTAQREERRFAARAEELRHANVQVGRVRAVFDPAIDLLPGLGALLVLLVGTVRVQAGAIGTGDVVSAAYLLTLLAVPVRAFGWVLGELPRALVGYERIGRVIDARGELVPGTVPLAPEGTVPLAPEGAVPLAPEGTVPLAPVLVRGGLRVEMRGVGVDVPAGAGTSTLLSGIDLDLAPGRTVALVGPTGAGKTTLVGLLSRLSDPTTGTVTLDGVDVRDARPRDLTAQVALVAQSTFLFEDSVRANVTLADPDDPAAPDDDRVWDALRLARVDAVVAALPGGLDARLGERGANLSGGQRQRLAIARALVRNPRLLVLDDATSAVDPRVERQILTGLRERGADADRPTVLMVAYRMSSVLLADEVVHLEAGRIVDRGSHAELLVRDPGYADLATAYERETQRRADDRANGLLADGDLTDLDDLETDEPVNDTAEPVNETAEDRR